MRWLGVYLCFRRVDLSILGRGGTPLAGPPAVAAHADFGANLVFWNCVLSVPLSGSPACLASVPHPSCQDQSVLHFTWSPCPAASHRPELTCQVVDYLEGGALHPGYSSASHAAMSAPVLFVLDECPDPLELQHLQASLQATLTAVPLATRVGVITYGKAVSVYDLSHSGVAAADVIPGEPNMATRQPPGDLDASEAQTGTTGLARRGPKREPLIGVITVVGILIGNALLSFLEKPVHLLRSQFIWGKSAS
jgi:hypothetical protein